MRLSKLLIGVILALSAALAQAQAKVRAGDYRLEFLDYDWRLNDLKRAAR